MKKTTLITLLVGAFFLCGAGAIVYYGRPVMQVAQEQNTPEVSVPPQTPPPVTITENPPKETSQTPPPTVEIKEVQTTLPPEENQETPEPGTYSAAQVATHARESDCWAIVGGNVYDLTTWVERHPGGGKAILSLCGIDATEKFEKKHEGSSAAKAALALLKIGTVAK